MSGFVLDTAEMEARLEQRICQRMEQMFKRELTSNGAHGKTQDRWMPLGEVATLIARSKRTVEDMTKREEFPRWATILKGTKMWWASEVEAWMREQANGGGSQLPARDRQRKEGGRFKGEKREKAGSV